MFSVYGVTGRLFKGAMEDLRQVKSVGAVARTRKIASLTQFTSSDASTSTAPPAPAHGDHHNLLAAYVQTEAVHLPRHPLSRVADVMNRGVISVPASAQVLEAWQVLDQHGISQAPVVDANGFLVGLLSRAELLRLDRLPLPDSSSLVWRALLAQPVSDIMSSPIPAVAEETDIRRVARVLLDSGLPGLPVVDEGGAVTGFVSRTDILSAVVHDPPLDLWS